MVKTIVLLYVTNLGNKEVEMKIKPNNTVYVTLVTILFALIFIVHMLWANHYDHTGFWNTIVMYFALMMFWNFLKKRIGHSKHPMVFFLPMFVVSITAANLIKSQFPTFFS